MAARKIKRTITLWQSRYSDIGAPFDDSDERHIYRVVALQNALEPPVGAMLTAEEVAAMITSDWTVNVKEGK